MNKKQEYEYKYIIKSACQMKNNEIINIADILNDYAKQGYKVIHTAYHEHLNSYACILERKIIKAHNYEM